MKKLFYFLSIVLLTIASSCGTEYDDSNLIDRLNKLEEEQKKLEEEQKEMQEQIDAQQTLLDALTKNLTIISIDETDEGYVVTFSDNSTMIVEQGNSYIENIEVGEEAIIFTLADGTEVVLPLNSGGNSGGEIVGENNKIYYTTSDGKKLFPYNTEPAAYGAFLVSNIYKDGEGVLTFDDTITSLRYEAFYGCDSLTSITIPDSVTTIGKYAFCGCSSLTSITIPDSVTTIGYCAFYECYDLTSVTIGDSVITIGGEAFGYCSSLTSVTIGNSVAEIGAQAFEGCSSLTSVYCKAITPPVGSSSMFVDNASGRKIYVPMESVEAYKTAEGWSRYADAIVGYNF